KGEMLVRFGFDARRIGEINPFGLQHVDAFLLLLDRGIQLTQLLLQRLYTVVCPVEGEAGDDRQAKPEQDRGSADHAAFSVKAGASVRSATRNLADRARGLVRVSSAEGICGLRVRRRNDGSAAL